jgi:6-phosphogluconate dehydrogenase
MVGLGRMGANLVRRLLRHGHECVAFDLNTAAVDMLASEGAQGAHTLEEFVAALQPPRVVWLMVPVAFTDSTLESVSALLEPGDVVIDGGNSMWQDDVDRAARLHERKIHYMDIGTSGGVFGLERGYSLMIGGDAEMVQRLEPIFNALAPGMDSAPRTPDASGPPRPGEMGWLHCGPAGAGHFVKMIHNGIEYGMMAAIAEGLGILNAANAGFTERRKDAETSPLRNPEYYRYDFDTAAITELWRRGSVISSWLIDLTAHALLVDPQLDQFTGQVSDSGEGRWTSQAAIELGVPASTITASLFGRFASQNNDLFTNKVLSAMRKEFGGHHEKK